MRASRFTGDDGVTGQATALLAAPGIDDGRTTRAGSLRTQRSKRLDTLRRAVAVCIVASSAGCMSVPLSTIWKMHGLTAEQFFAKDPHGLRVAVRTDDVTKRGDGVPRIRIDIDAPSTKPICFAFALDPVSPTAPGESSLDRSAPHRRWYPFALSARGLAAFDRAKREVRTKDLKGAQFRLNVEFDDMLVPAEQAKSMPLRVDVALDRTDGYFTLFKETAVTIERTPADAPPAKAATGNPDARPQADPKPPCVPAE